MLLAMVLAACDKNPSDDELYSIISIMKDNLKWGTAANLMKHWFDGDISNGQYILYKPSDLARYNLISGMFDYLRTRAENNTLFNGTLKYIVEGLRRTPNDGLNVIPYGGHFDHIEIELKSLKKGEKGDLDESDMFYSVDKPICNTYDCQLERFSERDEYIAAFGSSALRVVASGNVTVDNDIATININQAGIYFRDSYDFIGEQPLGCWSTKEPYVGLTGDSFIESPFGLPPVGNPDYICVCNESFRNYNIRKGDEETRGNFKIFTDPKEYIVKTNQSFEYKIEPYVDKVFPENAEMGKTTIFTVKGVLPTNLIFSLQDCVDIEQINLSLTERQFRCTPNKLGEKNGEVRIGTNDKLLYTFKVNVAGAYCGQKNLGQDIDILYWYSNGKYEVYRQCAHGCNQEANECKSALSACPLTNGLYCGNSSSIVDLSLDSDTLYRCENGTFWMEERCGNRGCEVMGSGKNDTCRTCEHGTGLYCGSIIYYPSLNLDKNTLYSCNNGIFSVHEQCANGCEVMESGVDDRCKEINLPAVDSVSPNTATLNEPITFTVTGQNLPSTLAFWISECENITSLGGSSTSMRFSCTPSYTTGEKNGVIKDAAGGAVLKEFTINVSGSGSPPEESFTCTSGSQTVTWQGRVWQRCDDGKTYTWQKAIDYCNNLALGGYSDWRLPTNDELRSLVVCTNGTPTPLAVYPDDPSVPYSCGSHNDASYDIPTISPSFECKSENYWSSTKNPDDTSYYNVQFFYGFTMKDNPICPFYVRCVR